ncbi:MAG TPA: protein kinase [Xanthomonadaceae bacterium]|nr:protein kinase [Xanthomonadaceae bacterium]
MRFATAVPVGSGGCGRVLRAFDPDRGIDVALKLLHREDAEQVQRMLREAALQARLDHPNIGKVFETGEMDGQHYIAMQFIDGVSLDQAVAGLNREQRLALMLPVLDAVQAAHREGLIHRDIKPSNILVEKQADGSLKPYVVDFGLARETSAQGLTLTGQLLGTPGYLSPEQAEGRIDLDRRSDIFSLGVVLYELVCGRAPFQGDSVGALLVQVLKADPPTPDSLVPGLPKPLVRILMQCLERDPALRYQSARELKDDLEAFLDGRAVRARSLGPLFRLRRFSRANPALAGALGLVLVLVVALAGAWLQGRWHAAEQARLAQVFTRTATEVAKDAQLLTMRPRQPLRADMDRLRERLAPLIESVRSASPNLRHAAAEPLGRALEALGEHERALEVLEQARRAGEPRAELFAVLGRLQHRRYQSTLAESAAIADAEVRAATIAAIERDLLAPTLQILEAGTLAVGEDGLLARALLAFHTDSSATAYAMLLEEYDGLSLRPLAVAASLRLQEAAVAVGEPGAGDAAALIEDSRAAYERLADIARSHPEAWLGLCRVAELELRAIGRDGIVTQTDPPLEACTLALEIDADAPDLVAAAATAHAALARRQTMVGDDPESAVERVRQLAGSGHPETLLALGEALTVWAQHRRRQGEHTLAILAEAGEILAEAAALRPAHPAARIALAAAMQMAAIHAAQDGEHFEPRFGEAADVLRATRADFPRVDSLAIRLGEVLAWWGYYRHLAGLDPMPQLDEAIAVLDDVAERAAADMRLLQRQAFALWTRGEHRVWRDEEAEPDLARAAAIYRTILERDPARYATRFNLTSILLLTARHRLHRDRDAAGLLEDAAAIRSGFAVETQVPALDGAWLSLSAAQATLEGADAADFVGRARKVLTSALSVPEDRSHAAAQLADLAAREHRRAILAGRFDTAEFAADLAAAEAMLEAHPNHRVLAVQHARLLQLAVTAGLDSYRARRDQTLAVLQEEAPLFLRPFAAEFGIEMGPP